jgi:hypothetical protein
LPNDREVGLLSVSERAKGARGMPSPQDMQPGAG